MRIAEVCGGELVELGGIGYLDRLGVREQARSYTGEYLCAYVGARSLAKRCTDFRPAELV